jgi:hypothetical protein
MAGFLTRDEAEATLSRVVQESERRFAVRNDFNYELFLFILFFLQSVLSEKNKPT